jgi:hypothetical protein
MELGKSLDVLISANLQDIINGCSRKRPGLMVLMKSTTQGLWQGLYLKKGEDLFYTYSLVARLTTIRVLLSLAASHGLFLHEMNIRTTFLNEELEEEIYMN